MANEIGMADPREWDIDPLPYVFRQEVTEKGVRDGTVWTSELHYAKGDWYQKRQQIRQGVVAGFLSGGARWAEAPDGSLLYGLDRRGKELTTASRYQILKEAAALRTAPRRRGRGKAKAKSATGVVGATDLSLQARMARMLRR